eukprot:TRINITY_DN7349_c0_g1_i1.p1 TRINITY_DN7349_c0_g1~~TRINITY_DN7349_c0_g1_i1.p1  ORF type:complete len:635 (-),score=208.15 TRINITY_DN7349_c0_g1_i1:2-1906(-)
MNFGSSFAFLTKKSWHHAKARNIEKVWKAEQATSAQERELIKQKIEEEIRSDTNVVCLSLNTIGEQHPTSGDPIVCGHCQAILNHCSVVEQGENPDSQIWKCEFCSTINQVQLDQEEMPKLDNVDYLMGMDSQIELKDQTSDGFNTIFCIDVSGSMDKKLHRLTPSILDQINSIERTSPDSRIAIVSFSDRVTIYERYGNYACGESMLSDWDALISCGTKYADFPTIKDNIRHIEGTLKDLNTGGSTALGPALLISCAMASSRPGSRIVIATDGEANTGLGSVDLLSKSKCQQDEVQSFYDRVRDFANAKGIAINILSIPGTDCKLEILGKLALDTGGQVDILDRSRDANFNLKNVLSRKIIATKSQLKIVMHPIFYLKNESTFNLKPINMDRGASRLEKFLGNLTTDTRVTFEYGVFSDREISPEIQYPIQSQVEFQLPNGKRYVRVMTKKIAVTTDEDAACRNSDPKILGANFLQQSGRQAAEGFYTQVEKYIKLNSQLVEKSFKLNGNAREFQVVEQHREKLAGTIDRERERDRDLAKQWRCDRKADSSRSARSRSRSRSNSPTFRRLRNRDRRDAAANTIYNTGANALFQDRMEEQVNGKRSRSRSPHRNGKSENQDRRGRSRSPRRNRK